MTRKSTIHDIARELNITASTVSRALNDHPRISEQTKRVVKEVAEQVGYRTNQIASALRSGKTMTVGVIVPTADRSFFSSVVRGIEETAKIRGYNVIITQSNDDEQTERAVVNTLLKAQVDGVFASVAKGSKDLAHFNLLCRLGIPVIFYDRVSDSLEVSKVTVDDFRGAYKATTHLIEQGFECIAHFTGEQHINIYRDRLRGYCQALKDFGRTVDERHIITSNMKMEGGRESMQKLLLMQQRPDAIFSSSDYAAVGAMQVAKEKGLRLPDEMGFVGFADEPFTTLVEPPLSSVNQHSRQIGEEATRLFFEQIEANNDSFVPRNVVLTPELIIRASSRKLL